MIRFSDGVTIDDGGEYRVLSLADGLYVVGHGTCCPVKDQIEADEILEALLLRKGGKTCR